MDNLRLSDLKIGLQDLFDNRITALRASSMGLAYEPLLRSRHTSILELPATLTGAPLAEQLAEADARHDGLGTALWHITQAYRVAPDVDPARREAAKRIAEALIPYRALLKAAYADEVSAGLANLPKLEALVADLESIPVADGKTLSDWAGGFVDAAGRIGNLLGQRGDIDSQADTDLRSRAAMLRAQTLGLLNQLREAVRQAVELDSSLPRDLESQIFNYLDTLEQMRDNAVASGSSGATTAPAATDTSSATTTPVIDG